MKGDKKPTLDPESYSLNLGLGDLLSPATVENPVDSAVRDPAIQSASAATAIEPREFSAPRSKFAGLAAASRWDELSETCEAILAPSIDSKPTADRIEAQIYWILAEMRRGGVPYSILLAPLGEVCEALGAPNVETVLTPDGRQQLINIAVPILSEMCQALKLQGDLVGVIQCSGLQQRLGGSRAAELESPDRPVETVQSSPKPVPGQTNSRDGSTSRRNYTGGLLTAVLLSLVALIIWKQYGQQSLGDAEVMPWEIDRLVIARQPPTLVLPPIDALGSVSELDALLFDLEKRERVSPAPSVSTETVQSEAVRSSVSEMSFSSSQSSSETDSSNASQSRVMREVVDTSGPIEPADFPVREDYDRGAAERGRSTDNARQRDARDPVENRRRERADAPAVAEAPRFEDFRDARRFKVLKDTDVMSDPTFRSEKRDTLHPGAEVEAEGREGYWLRIRSERGRVGYVFAQDVERVREW